MILESVFGLSLVLNVSLDPAAPAAKPAAWLHMSVHQKDAALLPLVQHATECIVRKASADPRYSAAVRPEDFNDLLGRLDRGLRASGARDDRRARPHVRQRFGRGLPARPLSRRAAGRGGQAGAYQDAGALSEARAAKAGRSMSVIGSVSSTTAATTISVVGTPKASPSTP